MMPNDGDVWRLGIHTLICADSSRISTSFPLNADTLIFDPPWKRGITPPRGSYTSIIAFSDGETCGETIAMFDKPLLWVFVWDCVAMHTIPGKPLQQHKLALWFGETPLYIERVKNRDTGGYVFSKRDRGTVTSAVISDVYRYPIGNISRVYGHEHAKPLPWVKMLIGNCTTGTVFDPFAGSGTTLFACEDLGRASISVEIDPRRVGAIIRRWNRMRGEIPAEKVGEL